MKIVIDGSIFELDGRGIAKSTIGLYKTIMELFPKTKLYILQKKDFVCDFDVPGVQKIVAENMSEEDALNNFFKKKIKEIEPDVIHFPFNGNLVERFQKCKAKKVSTIHDIIPAMVPNFWNMSKQDVENYIDDVKRKIALSDIVLADSDASKKDIAKKCGYTESEIIYWAPFLDNKHRYENKYGKYFLYNGGFCPRKGIEILIDNFLQLKFSGQLESNLVLTGSFVGFSEKLKPLIEYGKQRGWIIDLGYVSDEELIGLFQNAVALGYLSAYEGFGMPPLEALNQGCPVITCKNSSLPEVCGNAAVYVDRNDDDSVQNALLQMEQDEKLRDILIKNGKKQAAKFTWKKTAQQFMNTITKG